MLAYVISTPSRIQGALVLCWFVLSAYPAKHKMCWSYVGLCCQHTQQNTRCVGPMLAYVVSIPSKTQDALVLCCFISAHSLTLVNIKPTSGQRLAFAKGGGS